MSDTGRTDGHLIIFATGDTGRLEQMARQRGFRLTTTSTVPTIDEITSASNLLVESDLFEHLPLAALANHETRIWISSGPQDPWQSPITPAGRFAKRLIDIVLAFGILLVLAPLLVLVAIAIRLDTKGPTFHSQKRLGQDGRWFDMHKFRTMQVVNDATQHADYFTQLARGEAASTDGLYKIVNDPRITRIGRLLRRYSIDEIPQFYDVLRGAMSAAGPRPMLPREMRTLDGSAWGRQRVKPGITGLWQISGRSLTTFDRMIDLDNEYARNWSVRNELKILLATPAAILREETA